MFSQLFALKKTPHLLNANQRVRLLIIMSYSTLYFISLNVTKGR